MRKLAFIAVAVVLAAFFAGCAGTTVATKFNDQKLTTTDAQDVAHINGSAWGIYLFSIPVLTGSTDNPGAIVFNEDTCKVGPVVDMVTRESNTMGSNAVVDITSDYSSMWIFPTIVLFYRECEVSGNSIKMKK